MVRNNQALIAKDYSLLAEQPQGVAELLQDSRQSVVISAVTDSGGVSHVLSRYADPVWELWPFFDQPNVDPRMKRLDWTRIPSGFVEACKAVMYRYWMVGLPGKKRPKARTLEGLLNQMALFTRYLDRFGVESLANVQPLHISNYVHESRSQGLTPGSLVHRFAALDVLHHFSDQHPEGLSIHPWPESSAYDMAGCVGGVRDDSRKGNTPLIPEPASQALFNYAEGLLNAADGLLADMEKNVRDPFRDADLLMLRDACFYLVGVLTGMRCSEISGIEVGAWRVEVKDGITYHWVASVEHKTGKGHVEYLMPSMGIQIFTVLERLSAPLRRALAAQLKKAEDAYEKETSTNLLQEIASAKSGLHRLFLVQGRKTISSILGRGWGLRLKQFAVSAGVDWPLAPHQLRRLFGYTFVRHRLGNILFLKEQFKHSSLSMTQLYAANPHQEAALYDEILEEIHRQKADVVLKWLDDDSPLSGGAGRKIMELRAYDYPDRKALILETADKLSIRSTGHSWCLSQDDGCGGAGLYERTQCGGCGNGVIDMTFQPVWREIYLHQTELLCELADLGPGASARVMRDLDRAKKVLVDLGVKLDVEDANG
ncbi:MAG: tyrosine-type recombinase/integrase [Pseudomonadota bacterium]